MVFYKKIIKVLYIVNLDISNNSNIVRLYVGCQILNIKNGSILQSDIDMELC